MSKDNHVNIPVFIPHLGCPNMCVFCNQRLISGVEQFKEENAREEIEKVLRTVRRTGKTAEIAFFGGSFTGIDRTLMISLLDLAEEYVKRGEVSGIRMSTRPDYINEEIVEILKKYTVSAVELGIQSFDDNVLMKSKRGHTADDSRKAMNMLRDNGFTTVGQMMIGLPGADGESEKECAREIVSLGASAARIYPTVVFRGTELASSFDKGEYKPLTVEEAVSRSADVLEIFVENGVDVLRIGLCESENLHSDSSYYAGPNHPSLGELVYSEIYRRRICKTLDKADVQARIVTVFVPTGAISKAVGQGKGNINLIIEKYGVKSVSVREECTLKEYNIRIKTEEIRKLNHKEKKIVLKIT